MVELVRRRGSVADLHALDPFPATAEPPRPITPAVWWCDPTDDALVLGSRQTVDLLDAAAVTAAGLTVARRRSGGGAVIVRSDSVVWLDVVLPLGVAPDDVRGSMVWIGDRWAAALAPLLGEHGVVDPVTVHRGGMLTTPWSDLVCFAGIGPGEVLLGGRKLVGLSQRRTRRGTRIQGMIYRAPATAALADLITGERPPGRPAEPAWLAWLDAGATAGALAAELRRSLHR